MTKKLLKNSGRSILLAVILTTALSACKKDTPPPPAPAPAKPVVSAAKPVQKPVSSSALKLAPPATNQFDFSNKKDPFKPFVMAKPAPLEQKKTLNQRLLEGLPIHQFDANQFRLIGVVTGVGEAKAMVVDPKGKGYVLKRGMTIGKNEGKVTSITPSSIVITEQFKDDNGRVRRENIKITLPRKM